MSQHETKGDDSQNPPPTYDEAVDNTTQVAPGPAGNGRLFYDTPGRVSIVFVIKPNPRKDNYHQPWIAQMDVKCGDVPLLMREGFYWTTANVIKEEGFIKHTKPALARYGKITRIWILRDLQQPPRWTAYLSVYAWSHEVLSGIRLDSWTKDMVQSCQARGLSQHFIYSFDKSKPRCHFNSIYDDMPLKGWWPWPKKDLRATKRA
ncbi:hypothetical protein F4805DRAFT_141169 [Annulohypoxylon moriforme]|nr:hypothetical protein F4805DRAFT_141169 [Annulohypoxylon moriforme]